MIRVKNRDLSNSSLATLLGMERVAGFLDTAKSEEVPLSLRVLALENAIVEFSAYGPEFQGLIDELKAAAKS